MKNCSKLIYFTVEYTDINNAYFEYTLYNNTRRQDFEYFTIEMSEKPQIFASKTTINKSEYGMARFKSSV